jgi:hypothetical protein
MPIIRGIKVWFCTNLLGTVLFMFIFGMHDDYLGPHFGLFLFGIGSLFSLPAIFIIALGIHLLKKLPEDIMLRLVFLLGSTAFAVIVVTTVFQFILGTPDFSLSGLGESMLLLFPYGISALAATLFFVRDLLWIRKNEETIQTENAEL